MKRSRCEHCDSGRGLNPTERGLVPASLPCFSSSVCASWTSPLFNSSFRARQHKSEVWIRTEVDHKRAVEGFSRGIEFPELRTKQPLNTGLLSSTTDEVFMAYYYFPVWLVRGHAPL